MNNYTFYSVSVCIFKILFHDPLPGAALEEPISSQHKPSQRLELKFARRDMNYRENIIINRYFWKFLTLPF